MKKYLILIASIVTFMLSACINNRQTAEYETQKGRAETIKVAEVDDQTRVQEDAPVVEKNVFQYNTFSVLYDENIYYMDTDGIHRVTDTGENEIYFATEINERNLYLYEDRFYFCGKDGFIHSVGIEEKDETILCEGGARIEFFDDYLFTDRSVDGKLDTEYIAYRINPETGMFVDENFVRLSEISGFPELSDQVMHREASVSFIDMNGDIIHQKIPMANPMITKEYCGGICFYEIDKLGQVKLTFSDGQNEKVFHKYEMYDILKNDFSPRWESLVTEKGVFYTDIVRHGSSAFPIYYSGFDGTNKTLLENSDLFYGMLLNYVDGWLYYSASTNDMGNGEPGYGCYRIHVETQENECLYTNSREGTIFTRLAANVQKNKLIYYDFEEGEVKIIDLSS